MENYRNAERVGYLWLSRHTILILIGDSYDQIVSQFRHCPPLWPRHLMRSQAEHNLEREASVWFLSRRGVEWILKSFFIPHGRWLVRLSGTSLSALHSVHAGCTRSMRAARWLRSTINHSRHRLHPLYTIVWTCLKCLDRRNLICFSHQIS